MTDLTTRSGEGSTCERCGTPALCATLGCASDAMDAAEPSCTDALHAAIMRLRGREEDDWTPTERGCYRIGHRDARHTAAELVLRAALAQQALPAQYVPMTDEEIKLHEDFLEAERDYEQYTGQERLVVKGAQEFARAIESATVQRMAQAAPAAQPIDMVLHCPACHLQHIDAPDERTPDWKNGPHRSHLCHGCGHIWRPADVPTNGVQAVRTTGKADSPIAATPAPAQAAPQEPDMRAECTTCNLPAKGGCAYVECGARAAAPAVPVPVALDERGASLRLEKGFAFQNIMGDPSMPKDMNDPGYDKWLFDKTWDAARAALTPTPPAAVPVIGECYVCGGPVGTECPDHNKCFHPAAESAADLTAEYERGRQAGITQVYDSKLAAVSAAPLLGIVRRRIEQAIHEAANPKGMSIHDGKVRVHGADLSYLLAYIDHAAMAGTPAAVSAEPTAQIERERALRLLDQLNELRAAAQAVIDRWDTPLWKDVPHTANYINRLRAAMAGKPAGEKSNG